MSVYTRATAMGHYNDGLPERPGSGNTGKDGRGEKRTREFRPVIRRGGPSGVTIEDAGCIERIPPEYERCGKELATDSGAFCDEHKVEVRRNT